MRIGIDLGGTKIEGIVMDTSGLVLERKRVATPTHEGYEKILAAIHDLVVDLETGVGNRCRVGIGTPGAISARTGALKNSNTLSLNGKPIRQDLEDLLQREIRIENDANCFTLSEAVDGAAAGHDVVFGIIMGTGVGGGVVINKRLHEGPQHIAGEWGHNILIPEGRACYCGRRGCVETYLSGPGLIAEWQLQSGRSGSITAEEIVAGAQGDDDLCCAVMDSYLDYFGRALSAIINILDPDVIVLGGGMSNLQELYSEGAHRILRYVFNDELTTPILSNLHGDSSGVRGAARLWPDL
jgi:fructokinase